jgi:hypothetical protein
LLKAGPADLTPRLIALVRQKPRSCFMENCIQIRCDQYPNQENLDFSDVEGRPAAQTFDVPVGREVGEYSVMCVILLINNAESLLTLHDRRVGEQTSSD